MALTDSNRIYRTQVQDFDGIMAYCKEYFERQGYSVTTERTVDGGFVSLTKGGMFDTISGTKTGLNITLSGMSGSITVSLKIGAFGKQVIPTAIAMWVFWPIMIPQIYGLVQQNKLDTEVYNVIDVAIREIEHSAVTVPENTIFCVYCGTAVPADADFCSACGKRMTVDAVTCANCGAELPQGAAFCHKCGTPTAK